MKAISLAYVQQLREFCVRDRPRSIFAELHTNEAGVEVERQMSKQFRVLENILKLICLTHINDWSKDRIAIVHGCYSYTLQWATPSHGGNLDPHLTHGSLCPPESTHNTNGISRGSASFAELTIVTDRPTDHATRCVTIGCINVHSTAMWPKAPDARPVVTGRVSWALVLLITIKLSCWQQLTTGYLVGV